RAGRAAPAAAGGGDERVPHPTEQRRALRAPDGHELSHVRPAGDARLRGGHRPAGRAAPGVRPLHPPRRLLPRRPARSAARLAPTLKARLTTAVTHPGQLELWDWRTGQRLFAPLAMPSEPRFLDYSPDGQVLAVICAGGQLVLVDPGNGRVLRQWLARPPSRW